MCIITCLDDTQLRQPSKQYEANVGTLKFRKTKEPSRLPGSVNSKPKVITTAAGNLLLHFPAFQVTFTSSAVLVHGSSTQLDWEWSGVDSPPVQPRYDGEKVYYERGAITEQYIIKESSVEQQFIIHEPIKVDKSLVIAGNIKSNGAFTETEKGSAWKNDLGQVNVSDVVVFDAAGETVPVSSKVTASTTQIEIEGRNLQGAQYPITIDPEIGVSDFRISFMGTDGDVSYVPTNSSIAYSNSANQYLVVWEGYIASEGEIWGQLLNGTTGIAIGSAFQISNMGPSGNSAYVAITPDVASSGSAFLVVWAGDDNTSPLVDDEYEIFGQLVNVSTGVLSGSRIRISDMGPDGNVNYSATAPAVTYNPTPAQSEFLVVWTGDDNTGTLVDNEFEIFGQRITAAGAEIGSNDFRISDMGTDVSTSFVAFAPDVAWNSSNNQYLVVWHGDEENFPFVDNEFEIYMQRLVGSTGGETGANDAVISTMGPNGSTAYRATNPSVTVLGSNYLVVWVGDDNTSPLVDNEFEIFGQLITNQGVEVPPDDFRISDMGTDGLTAYGALNPEVTSDPNLNLFFVTWQGDDDTGGLVDNEFEIYGQVITSAGAESGGDIRLSDVGGTGDAARDGFKPAVAYSSTGREFMVVWEANDLVTAAGEFEIFGQRFAEKSTEPTTQPTSPSFTAITSSSFNVSFTAASGTPDGYLVLRKTGSSPTDIPADNYVYAVNDVIVTSTVVFVGSSTAFSQSGLGDNTQYFYDFFAYNGVNSSINYRTVSPLEGSANTLFAEPTTQGTFSFSSFGTESIQLNLSAGNGTNRLLVVKAGSAVDVFPVDGTPHTPNNNITLAPNIGSSNFAVGSGTGLVTVSGLSLATVYHFRVFEVNGTGTLTNYNTAAITNSTGSKSTLTTEPSAQPTAINFTSITSTSYTVGFTVATGTPTGYLAIRKSGSAPSQPGDLPVDGTSYLVNDVIGGSSVAYIGSTASFSQSSLSPATEYYYLIVSYNGSGANINYREATPLSGNQFTLSTEPTTQAQSISFSSLGTNTLTVSWTNGNGSERVVVARQGSAVNFTPQDGIGYTANSDFAAAADQGSGNKIVFKGAANSVAVTNLASGTVYHFSVFELNGSGLVTNYLTSTATENPSNISTLDAEPSAQPTSLAFSQHTTTGVRLNFTAAVGSPTGYLIVRKQGSASTGIPLDGTPYSAGQSLDGTIVAVGSAIQVDDTGLTSGTTYHYTIFSYNGAGQAINYLTSVAGTTGSTITIPVATIAQPATDVAQNAFTANWTSVSGVPNYRLDVSTDNFATFITGYNSKSVSVNFESVTGLAASTVYQYRVRAENSIGLQSANSNVVSATTSNPAANLTVGTISFSDLAVGQATATISVIVEGGTGSKTVQLLYKKITSTAAKVPVSMSNTTGNTFTADLAAADFDEMGAEFLIRASDASANPPVESALNYIYRSFTSQAALAIPSIIRFGGTQKSYQLISIPFALNDDGYEDVFGPALGSYDKTKWRLVRWQTDKYIDPPSFNKITPGLSYWFNSVEQVSIKPPGGTSPKFNQASPFVMQLAKGWNQIATPYPFPIDWDDVLSANGNPTGIGNHKTFNSGELSLVESNSLNPFEGGFVFADNATTLNIPVTLKGLASGRVSSTSAVKELGDNIDDVSWFFPLAVVQGDVINKAGGIGMNPAASITKDRWDDVTVPRFSQYLEANFYHPEFFWPKFSKDVVPASEEYEWNLRIESNGQGIIELQWNAQAITNAQSNLFLYDEAEGRLINMKAYSSLAISQRNRMDLKIIYTHRGEYIPNYTMLGKPWPNPVVNSDVTIPFVLSNSSSHYAVEVALYDLNGSKIKSLGHGQYEPGIHSVVWDGTNAAGNRVSNAMYLVKLKVNGNYQSKSSKLIVNLDH